jgi:hypothetical protein
MHPSLRFIAALIGALTMSLSVIPVKLRAVSKAEPAVPASVDTITAADVKPLREAIKSLHDRFEDQGRILLKNSDDLSTLTKRVDDYLRPSTLKPIEDGLTVIVKKLSDLNAAMGKLADAHEKQAADTVAQFREVTAALARLQEDLAKSGQASQASAEAGIALLRKDLATSRKPASASVAPAEYSGLYLGATGTAIFILAVLIFMQGRTQRRALRSAQEQLAAVVVQTRDALLAEFQARSPTAAADSPVVVSALAGTDGLAEIRAKLQSVVEHLNPVVSTVHPDDHTTKKFADSPADELTTARNPVIPGAGIPSTACWPAVFLDPTSPLAAWRERIESHLSSKEHPALPVFSAFLALRMLCVRQPAPLLAEVGAAVVTLSQALYTYWESFPDFNDDDRTRASSDWIQAVKGLTSSVAPKLEIREIIVGTRFDSDSMQTVHEGSGNHLNVVAVYSWATLDRSGDRVKVLHRAHIATN